MPPEGSKILVAHKQSFRYSIDIYHGIQKMKLTQTQVLEVQQAVRKYIEIANQKYNKQFIIPVVRFDLRGRNGGEAVLKENVIRVNQVLCAENFQEYLKQTIGHEVAHLIVYQIYKDRYLTQQVKPHGIEWKMVMSKFGLSADRCHQYDTTNSKVRNTVKYQFSCNCKVHEVGPKINANIASGKVYWCKSCSGGLKPGTSIGGSKHKSQITIRRPRVTFESTVQELLGYRIPM